MTQEQLQRAKKVADLITDLKHRAKGLDRYFNPPAGCKLVETNIQLSLSGHLYDANNNHVGTTSGKFGTNNAVPQYLHEITMERINDCMDAIYQDYQREIERLEQEFMTI